jgi:Arc/MetJ-type ribon-helix-helix transcriptional regulator
MVEHSNGVYIGSKIPQILKNAIENTISTGNYLNTSDFIRHAVKEKLLREGFVGSENDTGIVTNGENRQHGNSQ